MKWKAVLSCLLALLVVSGCEDKKPSVATTVYPVQYLAQRIGGAYVEVNMISEDGLIQRASIKNNYKKLLKNSDILFYIGELEPYMELYTEEIHDSGVALFNLATKSAIYPFKRYTPIKVNGETSVVESEYYEGTVFSGIDKYQEDPILWMDPVAMTSMASDIRDCLVELYPEYKAIFDENYDVLELDLARLDADFQEVATKKENLRFVAMTPSFGNWQKSYNIQVYPISLSKYGVLPNKEQLAAIKKRISQDQVRYIAIEENLAQDMLELQNQLIDELGLVPVTLHNLSSISDADKEAGKDYLSLMYENLKTLEGM